MLLGWCSGKHNGSRMLSSPEEGNCPHLKKETVLTWTSPLIRHDPVTRNHSFEV